MLLYILREIHECFRLFPKDFLDLLRFEKIDRGISLNFPKMFLNIISTQHFPYIWGVSSIVQPWFWNPVWHKCCCNLSLLTFQCQWESGSEFASIFVFTRSILPAWTLLAHFNWCFMSTKLTGLQSYASKIFPI